MGAEQLTSAAVRGRYAPSPTGDLHMGNLRTALLAWLFTRSFGASAGQFVLRVEDLDRPRVRPGATQRMLDDLRWLGLDWDEGPDCGGPYAPYTQSERLDLYEHYFQHLQEQGLLYPCYCSRAEVAQATLHSDEENPDGPRYAGTCRELSEKQRQQKAASGRQPAFRFRVADERIVSFADMLLGPQRQQVQHTVGDFIVRRSDGIFSYQFAVVVDDATMQINQVVRGADLLSSTARQILLYEALGFPLPSFAHTPLMLDEQGKRLAKRTQSAGLTPLRNGGQSAAQVVGQLAASCGLVQMGTTISPIELVQHYRTQQYDIIAQK